MNILQELITNYKEDSLFHDNGIDLHALIREIPPNDDFIGIGYREIIESTEEMYVRYYYNWEDNYKDQISFKEYFELAEEDLKEIGLPEHGKVLVALSRIDNV